MSKMLGYMVLSEDPAILWHCGTDREDDELFPEQPMLRIISYSWHQTAERIAARHADILARRPEHRLLHAVNDRSVHDALRFRNVPSVFCSQNAMCDETRFSCGTEKVYDAISVGRMNPLKRHGLAKEIEKLIVIGHCHPAYDQPGEYGRLRELMPKAVFLGQPDQEQGLNGFLPQVAVIEEMKKAHVGLCLSALEGAMWVAIEYLLCGLPVVSTGNKGGRNEFFHPDFTRIVPPDPGCVRAAVEELKAAKLNGDEIRARTIRTMAEHRWRLIHSLQEQFAGLNLGIDSGRMFYGRFRHQMYWDFRPFDQLQRTFGAKTGTEIKFG